MNNETNKANSSILLAVAIVGWLAFVATIVYGVTVYGPAKHKLGLQGALDPNSFSDPSFAPSTTSTLTVAGVLKGINGQQLIIQIPTLSLDRPTEEKAFSLSQDAKLIKRVVVSSDVIEEDGFQVSGGMTEDQPIKLFDLRIGDEIEFTYEENEEGEDEIREIIVF